MIFDLRFLILVITLIIFLTGCAAKPGAEKAAREFGEKIVEALE